MVEVKGTTLWPGGLLLIIAETLQGQVTHHLYQKILVEVNGIEPMTSCVQSRRSPN